MFIKGEALLVYAGGKSVAQATESGLSISAETRDISTKDVGGGKWKNEEMSILSWSMTTSNLIADDYDGIGYSELVDLMLSRTPVDVIFGAETSSTDFAENKLAMVPHGGWAAPTAAKGGYKGKAIITSIELNAPNAEFATYSVTFQGVGELTKIGAIDAACKTQADTTKHPTKAS